MSRAGVVKKRKSPSFNGPFGIIVNLGKTSPWPPSKGESNPRSPALPAEASAKAGALCPEPCALRLLVQQRHISHLLKRLPVSIFAFHIPHIYSLGTELTLVVAVPWNVYIAALENQHAKPVEDL